MAETGDPADQLSLHCPKTIVQTKVISAYRWKFLLRLEENFYAFCVWILWFNTRTLGIVYWCPILKGSFSVPIRSWIYATDCVSAWIAVCRPPKSTGCSALIVARKVEHDRSRLGLSAGSPVSAIFVFFSLAEKKLIHNAKKQKKLELVLFSLFTSDTRYMCVKNSS